MKLSNYKIAINLMSSKNILGSAIKISGVIE
jgi:hypothetical protein